MEEKYRYPIGQQDFRTLREEDALYIDKTPFIERIVHSQTRYFFLARPRRFGKSLFLSTLRYFFEGRRELFRGLYVDSMDWNWEGWPVLYLDLNTDRYAEQGILDSVLERLFREWENKYEVGIKDTEYSQRFANIIRRAHEKTGHRVVILVDEYDKPLVGNLNKDNNFEHYRRRLASIYSNFKSSAEHIRLVFLTGVSRFSKLSVFSDLNNLRDISFSNEFADVCGITERELLDSFPEGIKHLGESMMTDYDETIRRLKRNYDGYRFAPLGSEIYNPWSVLNAMAESRIGAYWNATGAASIIAEALHDSSVDVDTILNAWWSMEDLAGLDLLSADPTALLYQTGYLTMDEYDAAMNHVRLKVPNDEVKKGLMTELLPFYVKLRRDFPGRVVHTLIRSLRNGEPEDMMKCLETYFAGIPYDLKMDNENNFHNAFYILMTLIGIDAKAEVHTSDGRIDMVMETPKYVYIIELKYDSTPEVALRQIEEKGYGRKFAGDHRKVYMIGVNFSSEKRCIGSWKIAEEVTGGM